MDVTFTKVPGRRYRMTVVRERGPEPAPRQGPGYDDWLPHDAVHFLVEAGAGLSGGVFGRIAAGRSNNLLGGRSRGQEAPGATGGQAAAEQAEHADMARSEALASACEPLWRVRAGVCSELPDRCSSGEPHLGEPQLVERILYRLDEFAERRHALPPGGSVTLRWQPSGQRSARRTRH